MGGNILVVEDDDDLRMTLAELLAADGFNVTQAGNGRDAIEQLEQNEAPCLVLLDLMMPVMDGWEVIDELERRHMAKRAPVVVLTAATSADLPRRYPVMSKPIALSAVRKLVRRHCPSVN